MSIQNTKKENEELKVCNVRNCKILIERNEEIEELKEKIKALKYYNEVEKKENNRLNSLNQEYLDRLKMSGYFICSGCDELGVWDWDDDYDKCDQCYAKENDSD